MEADGRQDHNGHVNKNVFTKGSAKALKSLGLEENSKAGENAVMVIGVFPGQTLNMQKEVGTFVTHLIYCCFILIVNRNFYMELLAQHL